MRYDTETDTVLSPSLTAPSTAVEPTKDASSQNDSTLREKPAFEGVSLKSTRPQKLGEVLLSQTQLNPETLKKALEEQASLRSTTTESMQDTRLGTILLRMQAVTELDLLQALATQFGLEVWTEIKPELVNPTLAQRVPINFAKQHNILLYAEQASPKLVQVLVTDPTRVLILDEVRRVVQSELHLILAPEEQILEVINKVYAKSRAEAELAQGGEAESSEESEEDVDLVDLNDEAPIIRWVNSIIFHAVRMKASDIHVEPREKDLMVRYRIDGVLEEYKRAPRNFINAILARIKIMAGLNIAEKRLPQDGRIRRKMAGKDIDMRVATVPTGFGERITIRLLDRSSVVLDLADLGFGEDHLASMLELINRPHGILLVTGPTGSGKTTTLYAALAKINKPDINIMTVEDPVEYQLEGISQIQVNPKIELTFASAIRSFLRHDPDVIMVGEIRDQETAGMAITASLTGHLVFSTIHTNDAAGAINRLIDMGIEPFLVTSSLAAVLAQRLVRRLCRDCREAYVPTADELTRVGLDPKSFFEGTIKPIAYKAKAPPPPKGMLFRKKDGGCETCNHLGYSGRSAIYELLVINDEIRSLSLQKSDAGAIKKSALAHGMRTLRGDGGYKILAGITSFEEIMLITAEDRD